jgi:hypothetical protein
LSAEGKEAGVVCSSFTPVVFVARSSTGLGYPSYTLNENPLFAGQFGQRSSSTFELEAVEAGMTTLFGSTTDEFIVGYIDSQPIYSFSGASCGKEVEVAAGEGPTSSPTSTPTATPTVSPTASPAASDCPGDCDGVNGVTIDELMLVLSVVLDGTDVAECGSADASADGFLTVDEVVLVLRHLLRGCERDRS